MKLFDRNHKAVAGDTGSILSTRALFFVGGFGAASWAPLVPLLKVRLAIGEDVLGMLLLCIGIGSLLTMPLYGAASTRFGCRRVLVLAGAVYGLLLLVLAQVDSLALAAATLLAFGATMGAIDVVINIQAVMVETAARRRLMSGMHAFWSIGGFVGAGLFGVWVGTFSLTPLTSTVIATALILVLLYLSKPYLLPYGSKGGRGKLLAIPHGIVTFIGLIAMIAFLAEGAIMDWGGVFLTQEKSFPMSSSGVAFTIFSLAMLIMRLLGDSLVTRLGQKFIVLFGIALSFLGFMSVIFVESETLMLAGFFLIGIGTANVVPVFYSLMGKQNDMPLALAVPAVSTLGYTGTLMGPAVIGFIAHATSLYAAFIFLGTLVAIEGFLAYYVYKKIL